MTQKQDLRERCSYLLILFKAKDKALFEKYSAELAKISAEKSTEFYNFLLAEYKKLVEGAPLSPPAPKTPAKKKAPVKKVAKKVAAKPKKKKKVSKKRS